MALRRYAPLGRCMYCLASGPALSEEHLIPKSLGGRLTLRDSVCAPCRERTGRLEQATLDRDFVIPKTLLAMKRRRARKSGPRHLPALTLAPAEPAGAADAPDESTRLAPTASQYPRTFSLPTFAPAGLLCDMDRTGGPSRVDHVTCRLQVGTARDEVATQARPLADPLAFGYSIAKWAYALAVAERGLACCETQAIRQLLLGERHDAFNFIGNPEPREPADVDALHSFALRERGGWLTVVLNLLGSAGLPPYEIAIGPMTRRSAAADPAPTDRADA